MGLIIPANRAVGASFHKIAETYKRNMEMLQKMPPESLNFLQKRELGNFKTAKAMLEGAPTSPVLNIKV